MRGCRERAHIHAHLPVEGGDAAERLVALRSSTSSSLSADFPQERHGREGREPFRQNDRPRARPAAAMRRRKGLVQVDVHGVDAEIAGRATPTIALKFAPSQ